MEQCHDRLLGFFQAIPVIVFVMVAALMTIRCYGKRPRDQRTVHHDNPCIHADLRNFISNREYVLRDTLP